MAELGDKLREIVFLTFDELCDMYCERLLANCALERIDLTPAQTKALADTWVRARARASPMLQDVALALAGKPPQPSKPAKLAKPSKVRVFDRETILAKLADPKKAKDPYFNLNTNRVTDGASLNMQRSKIFYAVGPLRVCHARNKECARRLAELGVGAEHRVVFPEPAKKRRTLEKPKKEANEANEAKEPTLPAEEAPEKDANEAKEPPLPSEEAPEHSPPVNETAPRVGREEEPPAPVEEPAEEAAEEATEEPAEEALAPASEDALATAEPPSAKDERQARLVPAPLVQKAVALEAKPELAPFEEKGLDAVDAARAELDAVFGSTFEPAAPAPFVPQVSRAMFRAFAKLRRKGVERGITTSEGLAAEIGATLAEVRDMQMNYAQYKKEYPIKQARVRNRKKAVGQ